MANTPEGKSTSANTGDLEARVAEKLEITKKEAKLVVRTVFEQTCDLVKSAGRLQIVDFGILGVKTVGPRTGRNPKTGEAMKLKATKAISFKTAKGFKELVRS